MGVGPELLQRIGARPLSLFECPIGLEHQEHCHALGIDVEHRCDRHVDDVRYRDVLGGNVYGLWPMREQSRRHKAADAVAGAESTPEAEPF